MACSQLVACSQLGSANACLTVAGSVYVRKPEDLTKSLSNKVADALAKFGLDLDVEKCIFSFVPDFVYLLVLADRSFAPFGRGQQLFALLWCLLLFLLPCEVFTDSL
ncbi:hypothetical protein RJT34_02268 [Clitoria ternatea]|uniref:Uncharacterized protein n=1 Tax=Clitoria ternatea TaxID=43366 RepID=A0AAN9KJU0_CLITE